jgi:hypothetical protein
MWDTNAQEIAGLAGCQISASPLLDVLFPARGLAEPVLEADCADARVIAGGQRLIVQLRAEVARVNVCDHLASVFGCGQDVSSEFVERKLLGAGHLDSPVHRRPDRKIGQCGGDIVRCNRLHKGRRQPNYVAVGARFDNAVDELEELRRMDDRIRIPEALINFSWAIFARK